MRTTLVLIVAALAATGLHAAEAVLELLRDQGAPALRIWGSRKYDWLLEASPDLHAWSALPDQPPLLANRTNPPVRRLPALTAPGGQFYRARQTEGLYDLSLLRTISLTFTQANWPTLLTQGRTTGSNTPALLVMDNGRGLRGWAPATAATPPSPAARAAAHPSKNLSTSNWTSPPPTPACWATAP